jgi:hypothetical protein
VLPLRTASAYLGLLVLNWRAGGSAPGFAAGVSARSSFAIVIGSQVCRSAGETAELIERFAGAQS